jgi:hypothetical protein
MDRFVVTMGMSWVVLITDGDAVRQTYRPEPQVLLDAALSSSVNKFPRRSPAGHRAVDFGPYGQWFAALLDHPSEPFGDREWQRHRVPPDAWQTIMQV